MAFRNLGEAVMGLFSVFNERASGSLAYNITHTYDAVGNRLFEDSGTQRATFTYDSQTIRAIQELVRRENVQKIHLDAKRLLSQLSK